MGVLDWFKKAPLPNPVLTPQDVQLVRAPAAVIIRPRKWVTHGGRVGIIASIPNESAVEVHWVNSQGVTVEAERLHPGNLKIARYEEIPECRRPADRAEAACLGYV